MTTRQAGGIALVLTVISALLLASLQTFELFEARHSLAQSRALQDASVREVALVKQRYETLAAGIEELARSGDPGAKTVIEEMRRQGLALPEAKP